jgi:hypothetical protein
MLPRKASTKATLPSARQEEELEYDYTRSTYDNYQLGRGEPHEEFGPYRGVRQELDRGYHGCYTRERQQLQDVVISRFLRASLTQSQERPWLIFTAGPMGAGKSWTVTPIAQHIA